MIFYKIIFIFFRKESCYVPDFENTVYVQRKIEKDNVC